jgi:hypothetical protein
MKAVPVVKDAELRRLRMVYQLMPSALRLILLVLLCAAPVTPTTAPTVPQKCQKVVDTWKDRFAEEGFHYVVAPPFVIAGNGTPRQIERYRDQTVLASAKALKATYFKTDPGEPVLILLFETEGPYKRLAKKWFDKENVPHYGYFRHDNIMLMNVGTGTGTLVHELTHALIKPDFPDVPSWFNEGLASLYEQCSLGGTPAIRGLVNWRLPGLQKAIKDGTLRSLEELIDDPRFYREDLVGVNYAQARYLMLYLQDKGLLVKYYTSFRDSVANDPTGLAALKKIIAPQTLDDFESDWRKWVMALRFE